MKNALKLAVLSLLVAAPPLAVAQDGAAATDGLFGPREQALAVVAGMTTKRLQDVYLRCADQSTERVLDVGEAVACGMVADTLMRRQFDGDLDAMLAWWRTHRDRQAAR